MIVGFTGSQSGMTPFQKNEIKTLLEYKGCSEFAFGDCIGSDIEAANIAVDSGVEIFTVFPPDNPNKRAFFADPKHDRLHVGFNTPYIDVELRGKRIKVRWMPTKAYLERNKDIVNYCGFLVATPKEFKHTIRSGTWSTIRYAWKLKKDIVIVPPVERTQEAI